MLVFLRAFFRFIKATLQLLNNTVFILHVAYVCHVPNKDELIESENVLAKKAERMDIQLENSL